MYLKRLEAQGFKSFANKTTLDFGTGVTCVIGPNGTGKTNVADSLRWVLGEHASRTLRARKTEDVIFAGSDKRAPMGMADVSITLDNSTGWLPIDYADVVVTRRAYRDGENEYYINHNRVRLRDIVDLFMDSGLGKEAFSVISQGRVDEILNSKPEDRRAIFEEAAGVLKYKQRRRKAEHKLFETEDNLNRVLDILHELDGRLEPLRFQASAAKDYLAMSGELNEIGAALLSHDIRENEKQLAEVRKQLKEAAGLEQAAAEEAGRHEAELGRLREEADAVALAQDPDGTLCGAPEGSTVATCAKLRPSRTRWEVTSKKPAVTCSKFAFGRSRFSLYSLPSISTGPLPAKTIRKRLVRPTAAKSGCSRSSRTRRS